MNMKGYKTTIRHFVVKKVKSPILAVGHTGLGKTAIPYQVFWEMHLKYNCVLDKDGMPTTDKDGNLILKDKLEYGYAYINMTGMEATDLMGYPSPNTEKGVTEFLPPSWLKVVEDYPCGVLVIDEVNRMDLQVRQAYMQFLERREIGNVKLPDGWVIVQTANPPEDGYHVADWDEALVRRAIDLYVEGDLSVWLEYAMNEWVSPFNGQKGFSPRILSTANRLTGKGLNRECKASIQKKATYAGLEYAEILEESELGKLGPELARAIMAGAIGWDGADMWAAALNDDKSKKVLSALLHGGDIPKGVSADVLLDVMFLFLDVLKNDGENVSKPAHMLWKILPDDNKLAFANYCYPTMLQYAKPYAEFKKEHQKWCVDNMIVMGPMA